MSKINLSPVLLLVAIALLFWAAVLKAISGELPPLISLFAIAALLVAIYAELYIVNRKQ
jgi:hypothetical protein